MNLEISKSIKYLIIGSIVFVVGISTVLLVLVKGYSFSSQSDPDNIESTSMSTALSFAPITYNNLTIKGYLKNEEGLPQDNKTIAISVDSVAINNTLIDKNMTMGKTVTDRSGCFYFDSWNTTKMDELRSELDNETHVKNAVIPATIAFKSSFLGDKRLGSSFSFVNGSYENMLGLAGLENVYIRVLLTNGTEALQNLDLQRGQSYNYTMEILVGDLHTNLKMDIRNLPCGITSSLPENADLNNSSQAIIPVKIAVDKNAMVGDYPVSIYATDSHGKEYDITFLKVDIR